MTTMLAEVHDAFKDAGASDDKARAAASAMADYENRFQKIEVDTAVLKWMVGANIALTLSVLAKTFF